MILDEKNQHVESEEESDAEEYYSEKSDCSENPHPLNPNNGKQDNNQIDTQEEEDEGD